MKGIHMKSMFSTKKRIAAVALSGAVILGAGGIAAAYFTSTGTGTGTGAVGTAGNNITVVGTETVALTPAGPGGTVSFTASNGSNFNQRLSNIHLVSITPDVSHPTCATVLGTDFSMADVPVGVTDGNLAPSASNVALTETGTLQMLDSGVNQNACQGAALTLAFTTS
jgi:hypothetical protein